MFVDWIDYSGGYILEGDEKHYFFICEETLTKPSEICIPEVGERFAELEQVVKISIAKGERPRQG